MDKEITDEQLIDLLEGKANPELERRLASEAALRKRYEELKEVLAAIESTTDIEVPNNVSLRLEEALQKEKAMKGEGGSFNWVQIAAAGAFLVLGFSLGKWSGAATIPSEEISQLRSEIELLREVSLTSKLEKQSASNRIMAVSQIEEKKEVNETLILTLVNTLNTDESPNVRYAALQALRKFISEPLVKAELVKSLETQKDPLIQISLITILVEEEEQSAIAPLKGIIKNENTNPEVKHQAEVAVKVLT